ncbi:MAG: cytochrome c oxidase subunit 3 [Acidobacteria bacterium]|nr:cytochrome c oxidase subunit 3 [Acidobacteriota bacterium]
MATQDFASHAGHSGAPAAAESAWSGGGSPFAIGSKKLGMWLFIVSDAITFSALLMAYSYVRVASADWPTPFHFYPSVIKATVMTFFLLSSSVTMVMAVRAAKLGERASAVKWILGTMAGGLAFIVLHAIEWADLIHEGVRLFQNPWGSPLFGASFFTLTGLHMTHVAVGVTYLGVIAVLFGSGRLDAEVVEVSGLYWHFVDLVWMFIFPLVYLLSVKMG